MLLIKVILIIIPMQKVLTTSYKDIPTPTASECGDKENQRAALIWSAMILILHQHNYLRY